MLLRRRLGAPGAHRHVVRGQHLSDAVVRSVQIQQDGREPWLRAKFLPIRSLED